MVSAAVSALRLLVVAKASISWLSVSVLSSKRRNWSPLLVKVHSSSKMMSAKDVGSFGSSLLLDDYLTGCVGGDSFE